MGRKTSSVQKLRQQLRSARNARMKKQMSREMYYCLKCGWGWQASDGNNCPNCQFDMGDKGE